MPPHLRLDSTLVEALGAGDGPFLSSTGRTVVEVDNIVSNPDGIVTLAYDSVGTGAGPSGRGILAVVDFKPKEEIEDAAESFELCTGTDGFK